MLCVFIDPIDCKATKNNGAHARIIAKRYRFLSERMCVSPATGVINFIIKNSVAANARTNIMYKMRKKPSKPAGCTSFGDMFVIT